MLQTFSMVTNPDSIRKVVEQVVEQLKVVYHPERIVLFGSRAYGTFTPQSDVDLLIVKETNQPFHKRWAEVYRLVQPLVRGIDFSPIVLTPREVAARQHARDPFIEEIFAHGVTLYAA